jgi:soluble lytic murein transglycosylase-like protein
MVTLSLWLKKIFILILAWVAFPPFLVAETVTLEAVISRKKFDFPEVIYNEVDDVFKAEADAQKAVSDIDIKQLSSLDLGVVQFLQGIDLLRQKKHKLAANLFEKAKADIPQESSLYPLLEVFLIEAKIPVTQPIVSLQKLKKLTQQYPDLKEWRTERYGVMLRSLMAAKSDRVLYKTWSEYLANVRPAQRSDELEAEVANYLEQRSKNPTEELAAMIESMAAMYPYTSSSKWAFHKLQSFSCEKKLRSAKNYFPSMWLLSRLASNSVLDPGLKYYVLEAIDGPVKTSSGAIKKLDASEKVSFLLQNKLIAEAADIASRELQESEYAGATKIGEFRRSAALLQKGQVHMRQGEWQEAAAVHARYLAEFPDRAERRAALEALADSLSRLRIHGPAAEIYGSLATSPSVDQVIRWHHFWNTYLSGNYKSALELLERPGYVPSRDRGIEGGLDYWRGKIQKKLGSKSQADETFKKVLASNGDSFYSILLQASTPQYREAKTKSNPTLFHDGDLDIKEELKGRDGLSAKLLENSAGRNGSESTDRLEIQVAKILQKWGSYKLARRLLRTISWSKIVTNKMFSEVVDLAFSLKDYAFGLKVAGLPDSPFKLIPSGVKELKEHMVKHNQDWRFMYPLAHERLGLKYSDVAGIDMHLAISIMRAESVYDPDARSIVGAQGLMQIMPFTAIRIARLMGDQEFDLSRLHMPEVNMAYGIFYLRKLLDYYDGNMALGIAAYNAGPANVDRWVAIYGDLPVDEFVESIPFKETRRYVKSVLRNLNQYQNIYSEKQALTSLPEMPKPKAQTELF